MRGLHLWRPFRRGDQPTGEANIGRAPPHRGRTPAPWYLSGASEEGRVTLQGRRVPSLLQGDAAPTQPTSPLVTSHRPGCVPQRRLNISLLLEGTSATHAPEIQRTCPRAARKGGQGQGRGRGRLSRRRSHARRARPCRGPIRSASVRRLLLSTEHPVLGPHSTHHLVCYPCPPDSPRGKLTEQRLGNGLVGMHPAAAWPVGDAQ